MTDTIASSKSAKRAPRLTTRQGLIHYTAGCLNCDASVVARNAQAWAHNHSRHTGHSVELSLGWRVTCDG